MSHWYENEDGSPKTHNRARTCEQCRENPKCGCTLPFRKARKVRWLAALDKKPLANRIGTKMNNEPQVVCRPVRFERQTPAHLRNVPFADDKDYIRADRWDQWAAVAIGIAVLIVIGLDSAWLMGWLK